MRDRTERNFELPLNSTVYELGIFSELLSFIKEGKKTLEVRNIFKKTGDIKINDYINFKNSILVKVIAIREYHNLIEVLDKENHGAIWPGKSQEELLSFGQRYLEPDKPFRVFEIEFVKQL